jgi:quinol monooxygenase YgiN
VLVRIVRMTFAPDTVAPFLEHFDTTAPQIRSVDGCQHLELWRDADAPHICTTYSHWDDAEALNQYRHSDLFRSTWAEVKPLFADAPEAHSYTVARPADTIRQAAHSGENTLNDAPSTDT